MAKAAIIFFGTSILLLVSLGIVAQGTGWPPLELPPRQGEALDPAALAIGQFVHSKDAESRVVREPLNTWSNLAFVAAGAMLVARSVHKCSRLVGWALVAVGIGSFLYHASASRTLRQLDVGAMFALFFVMTTVAASAVIRQLRIALERHSVAVAICSVAVAILATAGRNVAILGVKPFGLTVATAMAAAIFSVALLIIALRHPTPGGIGRIAATLTLFAAAVVVQVGDRPGGWLCSPESFLQGHAIWHVFSAAAVYIGTQAFDSFESVEASRNARPGELHPSAAAVI